MKGEKKFERKKENIRFIKRICSNFLKNEVGQGMSEYGLIIALVVIVALSGFTAYVNMLSNKYNFIQKNIK